MSSRLIRSLLCGLALALGSAAPGLAQYPTYQGQLTDGNTLANGTYDIWLSLYANASGGSPIETSIHSGVIVADGLFTVPLDFALAAWGDGGPRWLEIKVSHDNILTTLSPRQPVTPAPTALNAVTAQKLAGFSSLVTTVSDQVVAPTADSSGTNIANGPWQSFTPAISGDLVAVEVRVAAFNYAGGRATARVYSGEGVTGTLLRTTTVDIPVAFNGMLRIPFDAGVTLSAGTRYTLAMDGIYGPSWFYVDGDTYSAGRGEPNAAADYRMTTFMAPTGSAFGWAAAKPFGVGTGKPAGDVTIGNYQGGTAGSFVADFAKQVVIGGDYNTPPNLGDAVKLLIADYDNESSNIYPIYVEDENNKVDFFLRANGMEKTAYFGGSVGIGTKVPFGQLHIRAPSVGSSWQVRLENTITPGILGAGLRCSDLGFLEATSQVLSANNPFARLTLSGTWTSVSDQRLKKDIESADGSKLLEAALALRPVHYRFKTEPSENCGEPTPTHLGLIAQEVQRVLPEFVADDGKTMTLDYAGLSVVALGALQEQQQSLADANERVTKLQGEVAELRDLLKRLEERLADRR